MADYTQLLARAIAMLDPNTLEKRKALYDRARTILVDRLRGSDPTLVNTDPVAEMAALESSIRRVEADAVRRSARPEPADESDVAPAAEYQDIPPLKDSRRPLWTLTFACGALVILLVGVAAYSLWPRGGSLVRDRAAGQPANTPYFYLRQPVYYRTTYPVGTIIVDKAQGFLYVVRPSMAAWRYGIGVGAECIPLAGLFKVLRKEEWPGWKPPTQQLASADADRMKNPLGARALYLNTESRIHGTAGPLNVGQRTPHGCIRLINDDVIYLYDRTPLESRVVVLN